MTESLAPYITFAELCKAAPELYFLQQDARKTLTGRVQDAEFWRQYEKLKTRLRQHVGLSARAGLPDAQYSSEAYAVAHREIFGDVT